MVGRRLADFYLNHNVSRELGGWLRLSGHTARTAADIGQDQATDDEHLLTAQQQNWILITHNWKDFRLLHDAWRRWFGAHWPRAALSTTPCTAGGRVLDGSRTERELGFEGRRVGARTWVSTAQRQ